MVVSARGIKQDTQPHLGQSLGLLFAIIAAFLLPHLAVFNFVNFAPLNLMMSIIGVVVCLTGMVFFIWGRQSLGKNWSQTVSAKQEHELVISGPYHYVRHPMYFGGFIACLGTVFVVGGAFVFLLVLLSAISVWRVGEEDKLMGQQFPDEYPVYKKRTKSLIPFIW